MGVHRLMVVWSWLWSSTVDGWNNSAPIQCEVVLPHDLVSLARGTTLTRIRTLRDGHYDNSIHVCGSSLVVFLALIVIVTFIDR